MTAAALREEAPARAPLLHSLYLSAVALIGGGVLTLLVVTADWGHVGSQPATFWLFAIFVVVGELVPIRMPTRSADDEVTVSTAFALALLLEFGAGPAVAVYAVAAIIDGAVYRPPWTRSVFNAAQYALSMAAAAGVLSLFADVPYSGAWPAGDLPVVLLAGGAYFAANTILAGIPPALRRSMKVIEYLGRDLAFQAWTNGFLILLAPVIVVCAEKSLALLPLLLLPILTTYVAGRRSMINDYRASHDVLTDLPNRSLLQDRLQHDIALARRDSAAGAVMLIDLDDFKEVNDTLGHHHGDLLLEEIGPRLREVLRESDTLARFGGDEFVVVLPTVADEEDTFSVAEKIIAALEEPFQLEGLSIDVRASIGIACFPEHGEDPDTLVRHADVALYCAKAAKTRYESYSADEDDHSRDRLALAGQLRRAIERGELVAHYQPKVAVGTGRLEAVEALVRWQHPQRGLIAPDGFIPLAESTGLIRPLTTYMLDAALGQWRRWRDAGVDVRMAVNLSTRSLLDSKLATTVQELLDKWQVPASALQLEITESAMMVDKRRASSVLEELRRMGVGLAIDDFGTGYSSLAYLKQLPVDEVKVDKSFVRSMAESKEDAAIVRSIIGLGRSLGLKTTAEGIESESACVQLVEWGCDYGQGFYLGRPVPAHELIPDLAELEPSAEAAAGGRSPRHGRPWWPAVPEAPLVGVVAAPAEGLSLGGNS